MQPLLDALKDEKVEVRRSALLALGRVGKGRPAVEKALAAFSQDPDSLVKLNAVIALANIGNADESVIPTLLRGLASKEKATARLAGRVLGKMGKKNPDKLLPIMMEALDKQEEPLTGYAVQILRAMKSAAIPALPKIAALYDTADPETRLDIVDAVTMIDKSGDHAIPILLKALKADDPLDRKEALLGLLRYRKKSDQYLDHLLAALNDKNLDNRMLAIGVVRGIKNKSPKIVSALIKLTHDSDPRVRMAATRALRAFNPPPKEVIQALIALSRDKDHRVGRSAVLALSAFRPRPPEVVPALVELSQDPAVPAQHAVIRALGSIRPSPKEILPALEKCLKDKKETTRLTAAIALGQLGDLYPEEVTTILTKAAESEEKPKTQAKIRSILKQLSKRNRDRVPVAKGKSKAPTQSRQ